MSGTSPLSELPLFDTLFITGTDTGVGKTVVTAALVRMLRTRGMRAGAYKPVCSGCEFDPVSGRRTWSDVEIQFEALGGEFPRELICPQEFAASLAPPLAAAAEGKQVDRSRLRDGAARWREHVDLLLIEGAGGWLSPISDVDTNADLARDLSCLVLIVAANRLGTVNQSLLTIEAIRSRGLTPRAVILNQTDATPDASAASNALLLRQFTDVPVFGPVPHIALEHAALASEQSLKGLVALLFD